MEKSDKIFAERVVNGNLPANRAVSHSQQRRWKLNHRYAAVIACSYIPAEITHNPATNGKQIPASVNIRLDHCPVKAVSCTETF